METADGFLRLFNSQPALRDELIRLTSQISLYGGRPRMEGHWAIAYILFVIGREPAIRRWHRQTDDRTWQRCGFSGKPLYDTVHHHFALLEEHADAFRVVATRLILKASRESDGLVGRDIHIDGTEAETHARIYHDCKPGENCARPRQGVKSPAAKAATPDAQAVRQKLAEDEPGTRPPIYIETRQGHRVQLSNGCWYRTADPTAGIRAYGATGRTVRFWHGFNNLKAVDGYTGAVIATETVSASVNEADAYPALLNSILENSGQTPRAIAGDRGFSVEKVFRLNTRAGIASVFPWRKHAPGQQREDVGTDDYDEHGIPRCKKCGAAGVFESFASGDSPRLWFTCSAGCGRGSISCSKGWRFLTPLWRNTEAYMAIRRSHPTYEKAHWRWRDQWLVGPDNASNRPRRRGIKCHQLRANAAMLLEWLLVCHREGWLGQGRKNPNKPRRLNANRELQRLLRNRQQNGFHLPAARRASHTPQTTRAGP